MNGGNGREHEDREALRERLSAYLDGELAPGDTAALERHLAACAECRDELAALREVRALLRALPQPALPRSFALPTTAAARPEHPPAPMWPLPARARHTPASAPALARAAQWVGGLAAAFGLLLIVATAVLGGNLSHNFGAATSAGQSASAPLHNSSASQQTATATAATPRPAQGLGQPTHTPASAPTATHSPMDVAGTSAAEQFPVLPVAGGGLLAGGVVLFVSGSVAARRRSRRAR